MVVARDVAELQRVLNRLASRGGSRLVTLLRLEELKPASPLPVEPRADGGRNVNCGIKGGPGSRRVST